MYRLLFSLFYIVIFLQNSVSYATITKKSPRVFDIKRGEEYKQITIDGVPGIIEYVAEVKHTNPVCSGCKMYIIRMDDGKYYIHHKKNKEKSTNFLDLISYASSQGFGIVTFTPKEGAAAYTLPCNIPDEVETQMQTTYVPNLSQLPNGNFHIPMEATNLLSEKSISGNFEVVEDEHF